jgi:hypothetical protein
MKQRSGRQRAIVALTIFDLILLIAFFVLHIADIRLTDRDSARPIDQAAIPVVTDARAPEDASLPAGEAEQIIRGTEGSDRPVQGTLTVDGEQVEAGLVVGSFQQRGGPSFSLYMDSERFRLTENEGRCYVAANGNGGVKQYLELAFLPNTDAASVANTLLSSYGAVSSEAAEHTEVFGGFPAFYIKGSSVETDLEAYVVSVNGGCVTVVLCTPGISDASASALRASLDTLLLDA